MHQVPTAFLRIDTKKEGVGTRKNSSEFDAFEKAWRDGLKARGTYWEGRRAVAELQRKEMFEFLMAEGGAQHRHATQHLIRRMFHEIRCYQKELGGRLLKKRFEGVDEFLERIGKNLRAEERLAKDREIEEILQRLGADILKARGALLWSKSKRRELHFGFLQELLWPEVPRRELVSRRIEIDTRLQVGLGKVLLLYLRQKRVSLETVARLILLAYFAGGLLEDAGVFYKSTLTGRNLSVRNIRENLRAAKLHKAPGFKTERTAVLMAELEQARRILGPASSRIGVLPRLYLTKVVKRFHLKKQQITRLITSGAPARAERR